jgi:hypothetical protein
MPAKYCNECGVEKTDENCTRGQSGSHKGRFSTYCKKCSGDKGKAWRILHPKVKAIRKPKIPKCAMCGVEKTDENCTREQSGRSKGRFVTYCRKCGNICAERKRRKKGIPALGENRYAPTYLGVYIAERVLAHYFENVERTPYGYRGYDLICSKGYLIDVKSACISKGKDKRHRWDSWVFHIRQNTIPGYFMFLAFDNREQLRPMYCWRIPGHLINDHKIVSITNTPRGLAKWAPYEKPLDKILSCCETLKDIG